MRLALLDFLAVLLARSALLRLVKPVGLRKTGIDTSVIPVFCCNGISTSVIMFEYKGSKSDPVIQKLDTSRFLDINNY
jgi:hypothetical protein